jgi:hypothetical protein
VTPVIVAGEMFDCDHCGGFGYCQVYTGRVRRVFCDCAAGGRAIAEQQQALREVGITPTSSDYVWLRRSECVPYYKTT